jgi:hypothetical protein
MPQVSSLRSQVENISPEVTGFRASLGEARVHGQSAADSGLPHFSDPFGRTISHCPIKRQIQSHGETTMRPETVPVLGFLLLAVPSIADGLQVDAESLGSVIFGKKSS